MNDIQLNQRHHRHRSHAAACNMVKEHQRPNSRSSGSECDDNVWYILGGSTTMDGNDRNDC